MKAILLFNLLGQSLQVLMSWLKAEYLQRADV